MFKNVIHKLINIKVLNECGENIPRFVSHFLDELPPVTFNNVDVSSLLCRMERLHSEVNALRHAVKLQADIGEDLRAATTIIDNRVSNMERQLEISREGGHGLDSLCELKNACEGEMAGAPSVECDVGLEGIASGVGSSAAEESNVTFMTSEEQRKSSEWSLVVKHGRRRRNYVDGQKSPIKQRAGKAKQRMPKPIIGTGARGNISVVRTKLVSVFATKFTLDLNAETLSNYLKEKLGRDVNCQRIATMNNRYSSFKVSAECINVTEMYSPELWPEGSVVRRYYEPRKVRALGANVAASTSGASVTEGATADQ